MALKLMIAPTIEPVTLADEKAHLRVDGNFEDSLIGSYISAARGYIETICGIRMVTQKWQCSFDAFPRSRELCLPIGPVSVISKMAYYDAAGAEHLLSSSEVATDLDSLPARIVLLGGMSWPSVCLRPAAGIVVEFQAGYGATEDAVPHELRAAVRLLAAHFYQNREPVNIGNITSELPFSVGHLIAPYRMYQRSV